MNYRYFKFLSKKYVSATLSGNLRFGHFKYFRLLEEALDDRDRGDAFEGKKENIAKNSYIKDSVSSADEVEFIRPLGVNIGKNSKNISIGTINVVRTINGYIFCFSHFRRDEILENSPTQPSGFNADGCIEIISPADLVLAIQKHGTFNFRVVGEGYKQFSVSEHFLVSWNHVHYGQRTHNDIRLTRQVEDPNPYFKDNYYAHQNEARIVLTWLRGSELATNAPEFINIEFPDAKKHLTEVELSEKILENNYEYRLEEFLSLATYYVELYNNFSNVSDYSVSFDMKKIREEREAINVFLEGKFREIKNKLFNAYFSIRNDYKSDILELRLETPFSPFAMSIALRETIDAIHKNRR